MDLSGVLRAEIDGFLDYCSHDDLTTLLFLVRGLTWDGPQRETLRAYAHGIADLLLPREVPHA